MNTGRTWEGAGKDGKQVHARDAVLVKRWLGRLPNLLCKKFVYALIHFKKGNRKSARQEYFEGSRAAPAESWPCHRRALAL